MLSPMHVGTKISYGVKKKIIEITEIIEFYNKSMTKVNIKWIKC